MQPLLLPDSKPGARRRASWIPALALLAACALVVFSAPLSYAGDGAAGAAFEPPSSGIEAGPLPPSDVQVGAALSQTVYLPLLAHGHWQYPDSAFGVQIFSSNPTLSDRLGDMGAKWVRLQLSWSTIEPANTTPEHYRWPADFERELRRLRSEGVRFILTLMDNPSWAATYPAGPIDKVEIGELVEFMEAAVARYGAVPYEVKYWEFYNEPDNGWEEPAENGQVGYFGHYPEAYVDVLQAVYQPIKAVDPEAQVVFGGIAYDAWDVYGGPFVKAFLDDVLEHGGGDYFDVMNFHYYLAFADNWAPYGIDILGKYNYLRNKLAAYGVQKPFICTETSMWSDAFHGGSDELQSRYVVQVFARSMAADFRFAIWFQFVDDGELGTHKWGLVNEYYYPKPAYEAYQTLARQLGGTAFVRTWPEGKTGSGAIEAYEFQQGENMAWPDGTEHIVVTWTNDEEEHLLAVEGDELVQVDKYGAETWVQDGDDGQVDGVIELTIGPSPVYLRLTG